MHNRSPIPGTWIFLFLLTLLSTPPTASVHAQAPFVATGPRSTPGIFDLDRDREQLVPLDGPWRRHLGDDPSWADPDFDDSSWPVVRPDQPWGEQKFSGTAWYRARIRVPVNQGPLALYLFWIDNSYQVFADGRLLLSGGSLPPHPHVYIITPRVLELPSNFESSQPHTLTIALRVWLSPGFDVTEHGGIWPGSRIGSPRLMYDAFEIQTIRWAWGAVSRIFLTLIEGLVAGAALGLFFFRRRELEYLWFALFLLSSVALRSYRTYFQFHTLGYGEFNAVSGVFLILGSLAEIAFYYRLLGGRRNAWLWIAIAADLALFATLFPMYQGLFNDAVMSALGILFVIPTYIWILALLIRRAIHGFPDARLLVAPLFFAKAALFIAFVVWLLQSFNFYHGSTAWFDRTLHWPFDISLRDIGDTLFLIGMLAMFIHRFTRTRLREETYEREREAARNVQQILIPEASQSIPGFEITSIYNPASEVSGDFFQVIPLERGDPSGAGVSVLLAIGDVSGKGLPAALMVSLLVGTLRTYAETMTSPAQILAGLNRRLSGRGNGGFTTCLILRADSDGTLTIANAGHLAPYVDGVEIPVQPGLPLGILSSALYEEGISHLSYNASITAVTDGVVESRNPSGELFGFERTQEISIRSVGEIAQIAKAFGQDDDITVLKLRRVPL